MDEPNTPIPNPYDSLPIGTNNRATPPPPPTSSTPLATPKSAGTSQDTRTLVTILLLIFIFPVGFLLMWFWSHWKVWVKLLLTILPISIGGVLLSIVLVAINPAKQFSLARNTKRSQDIEILHMAIKQYKADNKGSLKALKLPSPGERAQVISSTNGFTDFCNTLLPAYTPSLPADPLTNDGTPITLCDSNWDTNYSITQEKDGKITISAPATELDLPIISITK